MDDPTTHAGDAHKNIEKKFRKTDIAAWFEWHGPLSSTELKFFIGSDEKTGKKKILRMNLSE